MTFSTALPTSASAGQNFASPSIVVYDEDYGAINTSYNGPVTIEMVSGETGTFDAASTLTVNAVNGVATFTDLAIDTTGTYQLEAIGPGQNSGTSSLITIVPATPSQLVWVTQPPSKITEGIAFGASLEVLDQYGNLETGYEQDVSVALDNPSGNPDSLDLGGTSTVAANNGMVAFNNITVNNIGDPYTLIVSTPIPAAATALLRRWPPPASMWSHRYWSPGARQALAAVPSLPASASRSPCSPRHTWARSTPPLTAS